LTKPIQLAEFWLASLIICAASRRKFEKWDFLPLILLNLICEKMGPLKKAFGTATKYLVVSTERVLTAAKFL